MSKRYKPTGAWVRHHGWHGPTSAFGDWWNGYVVREVCDVHDLQASQVYAEGAHKVTVVPPEQSGRRWPRGVPKSYPRTRTFIGEEAWYQAGGYADRVLQFFRAYADERDATSMTFSYKTRRR